MKKIILCNHTSSKNRGCDAIVKSTADLLRKRNLECVLGVHNKKYDSKFGFEEYSDVIYYSELWNKPFLRLTSYICLKVLRQEYISNYFRQKDVWTKLSGNIAFNVGGDTYCYGRHLASLALNKYCNKHSIPNIFWGFSIDEKAICDPVILEDLSKYKLLFPRESMSYELLKEAGINEDKLVLMADPAFSLKPEVVLLPCYFQKGNTVAINISPAVTFSAINADILLENYLNLITHILNNTNMSIALVPHVYLEKDYEQEDLLWLSKLKMAFSNENGVIMFDDFYTSRQLKYIISQCRFLITARTHASIAGYSSYVPTIVIGYSIKALGIAKDLFGNYKNYVIESQNISQTDYLVKSFMFMQDNENEIKNQLQNSCEILLKRINNAIELLYRIA